MSLFTVYLIVAAVVFVLDARALDDGPASAVVCGLTWPVIAAFCVVVGVGKGLYWLARIGAR